MAAALRVLVTRPAGQAGEWVGRLRAEGISAAALPLMGIVPVDDPVPVTTAWQTLADHDLAMFVSPNAVAHFFARCPPGGGWPAGLMAAAPGPGTGAALRAAGVPAGQIVEPAADAASFDSESLWAQLCLRGPWAGRSVLIVRGGAQPGGAEAPGESDERGSGPTARRTARDAGEGTERGESGEGREWLIVTLRGEGARVRAIATYRRGLPRWGDEELAVWQQAVAAPRQHLWWFSSSEAVGHLQALAALHAPTRMPPLGPSAAGPWPGAATPEGGLPWRDSVALATHPRIAEAARQAGFRVVQEVAPQVASIVAVVRSLQGASIQSGPP